MFKAYRDYKAYRDEFPEPRYDNSTYEEFLSEWSYYKSKIKDYTQVAFIIIGAVIGISTGH